MKTGTRQVSTTPQAEPPGVVRRRWLVHGQVQGVGFRPLVYRIACRCGLAGFVKNTAAGVVIEGQADPRQLEEFEAAVSRELPGLARIDQMRSQPIPPVADDRGFRIEPSSADAQAKAEVTVDTAVCPECLREMLDAGDRRYAYGLTNCTNCGPRFSIIRRVPYDRPNTTMAGFTMCPSCAAEYTNPADRRFHAQPIACPACGPKVELVTARGEVVAADPIKQAAKLLGEGRVVAIKGLGGFHLAVRADDAAAVQRLRQLKHRDAKPLALMAADLATARELADFSAEAVAAMTAPPCPIVLAPRRAGERLAPAIAPGNHRLGIMLPYTPIQHLLFDAGAPRTLVMTSGNDSDEPIAIDNREALTRLGPLCDALLWHDRPIERCVDDSVLLDMGDGEAPVPIRRARGYVPRRIDLPTALGEPGLCVGGELKCTVAVVRDGGAILSQHLGDLTHPLAYEYFQRAIRDMCDLFSVHPRWIAHDLHPAYLSTQWARALAKRWNVPLIPVQHHHAHAAAVLAEHGQGGPALAVVCDGVGYGDDATAWGGELLWANLRGYERIGHLRPLTLPGGDAAAKDTRRCGLALLHMALGGDFHKHAAARRLVPQDDERRMFCEMIRSHVHCIQSSGAGRYFDGIAALLGLGQRNDFEAQAALALESAAYRHPTAAVAATAAGEAGEIDLGPLVVEILARQQKGEPVQSLAALFHDGLAAALDAAVAHAQQRTGLPTVVLSGGVFCNQRLTAELTRRLEQRGLRVLRHRVVPPGDGGLSLGQAAVAAAALSDQEKP